ncbi:hypothetical protein C9J60_25640 [Streptomyces sp. A244]|uniref:DUF4333 domain-containing protein n=1 Tax=Streptomyces TaxID=1883 RepID=UPI000D1B91E1|nr:DUF4333 domain-containing protein [Streptomyces sp. A244]PTH85610.1 hypothetical protein C9J60_25640 [Streptomyces sp. A244]
MQRGYVVGSVCGVAVVAAVCGLLTWVLGAKNVQYTTIAPLPGERSVKVDGHPAVGDFILEARIKGWYHPLPWVGRDIRAVSCPAPLPAVVGATGTCTARAGGEQVSIPVRVIEVEGDPAKPRVTWKFER